MWNRGAVVVGLLASLTTGAVAADMPVKARPITPQVMNWTGFYGGVFGGYHDGNITQEGCVGLCAVDPKLRGGLFGLQAGFDYQFSNNLVVGAFGLLPLVRPTTTINIGGPGLDFHVKPQFAAVLAGRVGMAFDRWLPYVLGGAGFATVEVHSDVTGLTPSNSYVGPVFGAGVEYAFTRHVSVDFRYIYQSLPLKTYDFGGGLEQYGEHSSNFLLSLNYRL